MTAGAAATQGLYHHACAAMCPQADPSAPHILPVPSLLPLDFTFVVYDANSTFSLLLAFLTFVPVMVVCTVFSSLLLRRDIEAGYQFGGLLLSTVANTLLKHWWAEHRPLGSAKLGHGMPSDHAQCSAFIVTYTAIWMMHRCNFSRHLKALLLALMVSVAATVGYSRIHLGVHSPKQVLAGAGFGILFGALWGLAARAFVWERIFPWIEQSAVGRYFALKNMGDLPAECGSAAQFEAMLLRNWKKQHLQQHKHAAGKADAKSKHS